MLTSSRTLNSDTELNPKSPKESLHGRKKDHSLLPLASEGRVTVYHPAAPPISSWFPVAHVSPCGKLPPRHLYHWWCSCLLLPTGLSTVETLYQLVLPRASKSRYIVMPTLRTETGLANCPVKPLEKCQSWDSKPRLQPEPRTKLPTWHGRSTEIPKEWAGSLPHPRGARRQINTEL